MTDPYNCRARTVEVKEELHQICRDNDNREVRRIAQAAYDKITYPYPEYEATETGEYLFSAIENLDPELYRIFVDIACELRDIGVDETRCEHCGIEGGH